jgi:hypothetical protein
MDYEQIQKGFQKAQSDRTTWDDALEDIYYYVNHRKSGILTKRTAGQKKEIDVYDSTVEMSNIVLAAGLSGYMTNASQRWFELRPRDERLLSDGEAASFFVNSSDILYSALATSNFYQQIHETYMDLGCAGYAGLMVEEDSVDGVRFYARHPRELYILEDDKERVNHVYRKVYLTAWQAQEKFGDRIPKSIKKAIEDKNYNQSFEFIHYICPRYVRDVKAKDTMNKPFASYWASCEDKEIIESGGYDEFPIMVPRFYKNSDEQYGYSPSWVSLPEIKMLNESVKLWIKRVEREVYPPLITEHDGMVGTIDLRGAAINYQRRPLSQGKAIDSIVMGGQYNLGMDFINQTRDIINRNFFVDLFMAVLNKPNMTATEVTERAQEKMLLLGPVLGRLQSELLNPIIVRTFNILLRRGMLPQVPPSLRNQDFDVVYVSPLAKAQRALQARDTQMLLGIIGQMAQFQPDVLDNINSDVVVKKFTKMYSVDPDVLNSEEAVDAVRTARADAMQKQNQMASLQQAGVMAKDFAKADKDSKASVPVKK